MRMACSTTRHPRNADRQRWLPWRSPGGLTGAAPPPKVFSGAKVEIAHAERSVSAMPRNSHLSGWLAARYESWSAYGAPAGIRPLICPTAQGLPATIFLFTRTSDYANNMPVSPDTRGVVHRPERGSRCDGRRACRDVCTGGGRRSRVGLPPRCWWQVSEQAYACR
jgi:hypothetical protein